jgi:hypothetical protein
MKHLALHERGEPMYSADLLNEKEVRFTEIQE